MKAPRSGSRKAQVFDALQKDGPDAAMKLGLGLELAEGTMRSWFGVWGKSLKIDATITTSTPRVPKKVKYEAWTKGKDWGVDWSHKTGVRMYADMWWTIGPKGAAVGDQFVWSFRRCLITSKRDDGVMFVRQIGEVEYKHKVPRVLAKRA